ncbi:hypothetical protein DFH06DRAFT_1319887 [Mycena polygramma]|nr:hypothetical protein DFH06DRAFT_1319887 [Mycena polygramma]
MTSFKKFFMKIAVAVKKAAAKVKTSGATVAPRIVAPFLGPPPAYVPPPSYEEATDPDEALPLYSIHAQAVNSALSRPARNYDAHRSLTTLVDAAARATRIGCIVPNRPSARRQAQFTSALALAPCNATPSPIPYIPPRPALARLAVNTPRNFIRIRQPTPTPTLTPESCMCSVPADLIKHKRWHLHETPCVPLAHSERDASIAAHKTPLARRACALIAPALSPIQVQDGDDPQIRVRRKRPMYGHRAHNRPPSSWLQSESGSIARTTAVPNLTSLRTRCASRASITFYAAASAVDCGSYWIMLSKLERFTDAWATFAPITIIAGWLLSMIVLDFIIFVLSISKLRSLRTSRSEYYKLAFKSVHWISLTMNILSSILLLFRVLPHTTYYLIPQFSVGRIYTLRLLTTLLWRTSPPLLGPQSNNSSAADHGVTILSIETLVQPGRSQANDAA